MPALWRTRRQEENNRGRPRWTWCGKPAERFVTAIASCFPQGGGFKRTEVLLALEWQQFKRDDDFGSNRYRETTIAVVSAGSLPDSLLQSLAHLASARPLAVAVRDRRMVQTKAKNWPGKGKFKPRKN